jgi:hypothetical protein
MDVNVNDLSSHLAQTITAIGSLGTAAFGLLEVAKPVFPFINWIGFRRIRKTVSSLTPGEAPASGAVPSAPGGNPPAASDPGSAGSPPANALPQSGILETLKSNWVNGNDLASQKAIAKSLIKLHLSEGNAAALAANTNVDPGLLKSVAQKTAKGTPLDQPESDVFSRFDLIVTAKLDDCYQRADQFYRNWMRGLAAVIAVILALAGGYMLDGDVKNLFDFLGTSNAGWAIIIGLLATPLAPIAKDISTALSTAVNTMQLVKKAGPK